MVHGFDRGTGNSVDLLDNDYISVIAYKFNSETSKYSTNDALKFRPCSYEEILRISETDANQMRGALCINDRDKVSVTAGHGAKKFDIISIHFVECKNRPTCKSRTEIQEFVNSNIFGLVTAKTDVAADMFSDSEAVESFPYFGDR